MAEAIPPTSPMPVAELLGTVGAPPDNLGGATVNVGGNPGDLQVAINAALNANGTHKGNTYVCPAGATYPTLTLPQAVGTGWTCIRSDSGSLPAFGTRVVEANAAQMFKLMSQDGGPTNPSAQSLTIAGPTQGWRVIGMEATHNTNTSQFRNVHFQNGDCSRIIIERSYVHPFSTTTLDAGRGLWVQQVSDFQLWDSLIIAHSYNGGSIPDAQGIFARLGSRHHYQNSKVVCTSENILLGDQGSGAPVTDATIKQNYLFKPTTWAQFLLTDGVTPNPAWDGIAWSVKNLFEMKSCVRVLFEGNICENNWIGSDQPGAAILLNGVVNNDGTIASDIMVRSNEVRNTVVAFSISDYFRVGTTPTRIAIVNNLFTGVQDHPFTLNHRGANMRIEHNTILPASGQTTESYIIVDQPNGSWPNLTIKRNIWGGHASHKVNIQDGTFVVPQTVSGWNTVIADRVIAENAEVATPQSYPEGIAVYASAAAAGVNMTDGTLASNSPLKNAATDGTDIGVNIPMLNDAINGVVVPAIPVANFTYTQTANSFTIQFTDLSTNTPTSWVWSGPEGFSSTSQNPPFTFPTSGTKSITLVASNGQGSSAPYTAQITVAPKPGFLHVQTTSGPYGTTLSVQVPSLTVGNLLVVHAASAIGSTPVAITGTTDLAGNTYTPFNAGGTLTGPYISRSFYTVVTAGSGSAVVINATVTGTNPQVRLIASEYFPVLGAISFIGSTPMQSGGGASPMDSGALATPATGGALLLGFTDYDGAGATTPAGWTNRGPSNTVAEKTDPAVSTTYRFQPTYTGTQNWIAEMAIFASGVSGGPPPDTTAPTVPTGLAHALPVATDLVSLTWTPSFDAVGVVNYDVRRDGVVVGTVTTPAFTDTGLQSNTAYSYTVRANDAVPNSSAYSAAHVVTTAIIETGTFLPPRFMRGFGTVRGAGATDSVQTPVLGHGVQRTITGVLRIDSAGAAQVLFTKASTTVTSLTERFRAPGNSTLLFERQWANALGAWSIPIPSLGVRHFFVIRLDTSAPANKPMIKIDNLQQVLTTVSQPTNSTATQNTAGYMLGNQPGGGAVLNGDLGRFAVFNFITTDAQDASLFAANDPAGIGVGAVQYIKLDGTAASEQDQVTATPSVLTGTLVQDYEPPSFVTVKSGNRTMVGWVR